MEVERRWILVSAIEEVKEQEEAVVSLLELAGAEQSGLSEPRSMLDLRRQGVGYRQRCMEQVLRWYGGAEGVCKLQGLVELDGATMDGFRSATADVRYSADPMSHALRLTKYVSREGVGVSYISKQELTELLVQQAQQPRPLVLFSKLTQLLVFLGLATGEEDGKKSTPSYWFSSNVVSVVV